MDYFDPFAESNAAARAGRGGSRFLVVSFDTDWRFPTAHSRRLHEQLVAAGTASDLVEIRSPWGHDSFLLQPVGYHDLVGAWLTR